MIAEPNALVQREYTNIINCIARTQRGQTIEMLVFSAAYPTSMIISLDQCSQKIHTQGRMHKDIKAAFVEIISTNIWSTSLIVSDDDSSQVAAAFLQVNYLSKLF